MESSAYPEELLTDPIGGAACLGCSFAPRPSKSEYEDEDDLRTKSESCEGRVFGES